MQRHITPIADTHARSGITILEVLVAIGIIGLLAGLLLPAVQQARETARRIQCTNNLKQVITAYHEFEESHGAFPGSRVKREFWRDAILPYLEQPEIVARPNGQILRGPETVVVYHCPSDPWSSTLKSTGSNYYPSDGHGQTRQDGFYQQESGEPLKTSDITDGLSATVALSERLAMLPPEIAMPTPTTDESVWRYRLFWVTQSYIADFDQFADECEYDSVPPVAQGLLIQNFNHIQTPNHQSCTNGQDIQTANQPAAVTAASLHSGGVNAAIGDGSVRFISAYIDRQVWRALGTRDGGEAAANSAF